MHDFSMDVDVDVDDLALRIRLAEKELLGSVLRQSVGCFLWVRLLVEELTTVHDANET